MTEGWCEHCDLSLATCVHSVPKDVADAALDVISERRSRRMFPPRGEGLTRRGPTIKATIEGSCPGGCGERIEIDDPITLTDLGWVHSHEVEMMPHEPDVKHPSTPPGLMDGL